MMLGFRDEPSRLAKAILKMVLPGKDAIELLAEFEDIYMEISESEGRTAAKRWFWLQLLKTTPAFVFYNLRWRMSMLKNYLKIGLRNLIKQKGYSLINVSGLAIGMAICILIFLWVEDEVSFDGFHENMDHIFLVSATSRGRLSSSTPYALSTVLKRDYPEILKSTRIAQRNWSVKFNDRQNYQSGLLVDEEFFQVFTFALLKGNPQQVFANPNAIVITEKMAQKFFGNEDPMGKIFKVENNQDLTITGIAQTPPANSQIQFTFLAPIKVLGEERLNSWSWESSAYILLGAKANLAELQSKAAGTIMKYDKRTQIKTDVVIVPFKGLYLRGLNGRGPITYVYIFSAIAIIVLLIACINFMNLATARSARRAKEVGLRKVVGAGRLELMKQFFGESCLVSFVSILLALLIVVLLTPLFNDISAKHLSFNLLGNSQHLMGLLAIFLFTSIIAGSYPALFLSSFQPVDALKVSRGAGSSKNSLRKILVVIQFTAAVTLILSTLVVYRQLNYIWTKDLGFNREHVVTLAANSELKKSFQSLKNELLSNTDITNVTIASSLPLRVNNINPVYWEGKTEVDYVTLNWVSVEHGYFKTFDMEILQGREFSKEFPTDVKNYVINEAALKLTALTEPLGKLFSIWKAEGKIIGIVKNFHSRSLHNQMVPIVFTLHSTWAQRNIFVKMKPGKVTTAMKFIETTVKKIAPNFPFNYQFLDDAFGRQYETEKRIGGIFKYFTILAIFISCLGLFGLASFMAEQKTKEIGIRKVLGASVRSIIVMLSWEFIKWVLISTIIAFPIAYFAMRNWLNNWAYHTDLEIWIFLFSAGISTIVALVTVGYQSLMAAKLNPADSLRHE